MSIFEPVSYNIVTVLSDQLERSTEPDPKVVARRVAADVPDDRLREALTTALVALSSSIAARHRSAVRARASEPAAPPSSYLPTVIKDPPVSASTERRTVTQAGTSHWQRTATDYRNELLATRVAVAGTWKLLRDCTYNDLIVAAERRQNLAHKIATQGNWFTNLAQVMKDRGAKTVADLDARDIPRPEVSIS